MHDPMTQAFQICWPWKARGCSDYHTPIITIWHVDPETDGSDDSCGYSRPRLSNDQLARVRMIAGDEARQPYFQRFRGKEIDSPTEAETLLRQAFMLVGKVFSKEHICKPPLKRVTFDEASRWACDMIGNPMDNFRTSLSFLPGWSSNSEEDREIDRQYCAERFFIAIGSFIVRERRKWYQHPKWHFWHWKIQIHLLQTFQRWAFTRCATCGGRFKWGQTGWTNSWDSEGPRWFRSERDLHHDSCGDLAAKMPPENSAVQS